MDTNKKLRKGLMETAKSWKQHPIKKQQCAPILETMLITQTRYVKYC